MTSSWKTVWGRNSSVGSAQARCPQRHGFDPPLGTFSGRGDFSLGVNMGSSSRSSDGNSSLPDEDGSASQVSQASVQLAGYGSVVWPDSLSEWLVDGAELGSNSIPPKTLSDESINRGLVCAHMHFIAPTQKILTFMS